MFTVLVPGLVAFYLPSRIEPAARLARGLWNIGWIVAAIGVLVYAQCFIRFLAARGTPAIFFARHLRFLIGKEPESLVSVGLYDFSRNPMYLGVMLVVVGRALIFASPKLLAYSCILFGLFHVVVVFVEEPHLRAKHGLSYQKYCSAVPRWLGMPSNRRSN